MTTSTATAPEKSATSLQAKTGSAVAAPPTLAMQAKGIIDIVEGRIQQFIQSGQLHMPKDYSVANALKSAWLILQGVEDKDHAKALSVCTRDSIANSLLDMIVQGLNPGKKQGYFIVYGKTLTFQRSYFGAMAVAQMVNPAIGEFAYAVVYEGDKFRYGIEHGKKSITLHEQDIENVDKKKIVAAYCIVLNRAGDPMKTEIMTWDEIKQAWKQSKTSPFDEKGEVKDSSTHGKFTADMAIRTVINKTCKLIINASSDNTLLLERINRNEDLADAAATAVEIEGHANTGAVLRISEQTGEVTGPGAVLEDEQAGETHAEPICVCDDMIKQGIKEWSCAKHGIYKNGRFSSPELPLDGSGKTGKKCPNF